MSNGRLLILRIFSLLAVIAISVSIYSLRHEVEKLAEFGYFGVFLVALLSNATVLFPAPGLAIVFSMGAILYPPLVALAASTGGVFGELSGYLAGFSGQAIIERLDVYNRLMPFIHKYGAPAIVLLAAIPNPFFDLAGIAAGMMKMPIQKFFLACWFGLTIKMSFFSYAGYFSLSIFFTGG